MPSRDLVRHDVQSLGDEMFESFVTEKHEDRSTIATWLQKVGYDTGLVGKYLNGYSVKKTSYISPGWNTWNAFALNGGTGGA